ncbi:putative lactoylglutathione lyase [Streptomyces brevispora]|uniref:Putative lactoylglutathione lyase n=1 Tax=Streptomyces brevispora TaxID=887462 RepID=A0A561TUU3_9ACTN|nr:putative lactoylglutathione lyase [Streptomyces brevispora]
MTDMATTASTAVHTVLASVTLEVADLEAARRFYDAFGVNTYIRLRASEAHSTGFRGFTLALTVSGPATVDGFVAAAVDAGATVLKPATKSLWGYGGVVQAPDGTIWKNRGRRRRRTPAPPPVRSTSSSCCSVSRT